MSKTTKSSILPFAIRSRMKDLGINGRELCELSGVEASQLSKILSGKRDVQFLTVLKIAKSLRITTSKLIKIGEESER